MEQLGPRFAAIAAKPASAREEESNRSSNGRHMRAPQPSAERERHGSGVWANSPLLVRSPFLSVASLRNSEWKD
jgi:hypothetical protein